MRKPWKLLTVAVFVSGIVWSGAPAHATPLFASQALKSADSASVTTIQWRGGRGDRWVGPAAGFAAGVVIGSAVAPRYYNYGYDAYVAEPGYHYRRGDAYVPARRGYIDGNCAGEESADSARPSWFNCPRSWDQPSW